MVERWQVGGTCCAWSQLEHQDPSACDYFDLPSAKDLMLPQFRATTEKESSKDPENLFFPCHVPYPISELLHGWCL